MVDLTPIQTLGLVCLLTFSFFVIVVLFLECIGRFHCMMRITDQSQTRNKTMTDQSEKQNKLDIESNLVHNFDRYSNTARKGPKCIRTIGISSGIGVQCFDTVNCYCCWREDELDSSLVIALPYSCKIDYNFVRTKEETCAICLDELTRKQPIKLDCNHHFHNSCIMKWLRQSDQCPLCKQTVNIEVVADPLSVDSCESIVFHELAILDTVSHV
eukprot:TCONS_00065586-protein